MKRAVKKSTAKSYERMWGMWTDYWETCRELGIPGNVYMDGIGSEDEKTQAWTRFIWYLRGGLGMHPDTIKSCASAVRQTLGRAKVEINFARDTLLEVKDAMAAAARMSREEAKAELERRERRVKMPAFPEMTDWLYLHYWKNTTWNWEGMEKKVVWVAYSLMNLFGFRESNLARPRPGGEDHTLRAEDLEVAFRTSDGHLRSAKGGDKILQHVRLEDVDKVSLAVASAKRQIRATRKFITSGSTQEVRVIESLLEWIVKSGIQAEDMLCTCHRIARNGRAYTWVLTSYKLNQGIKDAARNLNLPEQHFSSSSMRRGLSTRDAMNGVPVEETAERGGWKDPRVIRNHYDASTRLVARRHPRGLTKEAVEAMLPIVSRTEGT